jgi:hypothetical protein
MTSTVMAKFIKPRPVHAVTAGLPPPASPNRKKQKCDGDVELSHLTGGQITPMDVTTNDQEEIPQMELDQQKQQQQYQDEWNLSNNNNIIDHMLSFIEWPFLVKRLN